MHEWAGRYPGTLVSADAGLERDFEERLRDSSTLVFRVAYSVLRHRQDAEDVVQEAFTLAYRRLSQLRDHNRFRAWLVRMTWRLAIDRWRADRRRLAHETTVEEPIERTTEEVAVSRERATRLWQAIETLPDKLRVVLVLASIEGHNLREVAQLLELPEGTVKSRLFMARKGLAEKLRCLVTDSPTR